MIEVKNLVKRYGRHLAVDHLDFTIADNQVFGFLGPNGAGKSTTMNIMTGCLSATEGQVIINGHDICRDPLPAKRDIGYLPEIPPLYTELTPYEYLRFVGEARGITKPALDGAIRGVMEKVGIESVKNRLIRQLSKGYRQRVGFAQAILGDPKIIILDEPTVGLDPMQIIEFRQLISELGKNHTVILSSHILSEISAVCDKVLIIARGRLVALDTPEALSDRLNPRREISITVRASDAESARAAVLGLPGVEAVSLSENDGAQPAVLTLSVSNSVSAGEEISEALLDARCHVLSMTEKQVSLEKIFLELVDERPDNTGEEAGI